ncbi:DUF1631 family protein [Marinagarivorans cellulosilyticus]|uniref:DUF1631 domain-containing protein n=1 Tax=Marinagarivorans cellulosilyticus TaxID=2721545 RepID=A0AAN1WKL9_9GAMM|nr:DUF1631 family protein [Marinagarivorans cellulosilyticus]BCD99320.1 hypothetical protein MARGE09_P3521 [Marinagarivorans cellulosilyticus]
MTEAAKAVTNVIALNPILSPQERANLGKLPSALTCLNQKTRMVLEALLNHCFEQCNDSIFHAADCATSTDIQNQLFDANRLLRAQQPHFCQHFLGGIDIAFSQLVDNHNKSNAPTSNTEATDSASRWSINLEKLENETIAQNKNRLASISTRIQGVLTAHNIEQHSSNDAHQTNPLHPTVLSRLYSTQITRLQLPAPAMQCISDVFQASLFDQLHNIYQAVDNLLDQIGVAKAKEFDKHFSSKHISQLSQRQPKNTAPLNEVTASILDSVLGEKKPAKLVTRKELITIIQVAQRELSSATALESSTCMTQLLQQTQKRLNISGELCNHDQELIKLIGVMFEVVTRNDNLEPMTKGYINRLQVTTIKVALLDKTFLINNQHPARSLLNELVLAGLGWQQKQDPHLKSETIRTLDRITHNIVENYGTDITIFIEALAVLRKTLNNERQQLSLLGIRLHGSAQGKAKAKETELITDTLIAKILNTANAAPVVHAFATKLWRNVMLVTAMRDSITSPKWLAHIHLLEDICHLTTACTNTADKIERSNALPKAMQYIQQALTTCAHNAFDTAEILEELHRTLCSCLKGKPAPTHYQLKNSHQNEAPAPGSLEVSPKTNRVLKSQYQTTAATPASANTAQPKTEQDTPADALLREQVAQFPRGALFNWEAPDKGTIRCQLAAIIKQTNRYIFINRNGIKVIDMAIDDVITAIKSEQLIPLENNRVFDKALEEVVTGLRRNQTDSISNRQ